MNRALFPAIFWALIILVLCAIPGRAIPHLAFLDWLRPDKVTHLILFAVFSFLLIRGFQKQNPASSLRNAKLCALILSIAYGIFIELFQEYVTIIHRTGQVFDAVADAIGAFIGLWIYNRTTKKSIAS